MFSDPKITLNNYVSYFVSPYNVWFRELGHPQLDIQIYEDGEWSIIQFFKSPVIPSLTPWNHVMTKMRHVEINPWICKKLIDNIDVEKRFVWDEQDRKDRAARDADKAERRHVEDLANRQLQVIKNSPNLMNRIVKHGLKEMSLKNLIKHVPSHQI